jgi:hypothetical protein
MFKILIFSDIFVSIKNGIMKAGTLFLILTLLFSSININTFSQQPLPEYQPVAVKSDWLVAPITQKAALFQDKDKNIVLSNGLISRTFSISPDAATIGFDNLMTNQGLLRSVRPEAEVEIDGIRISVGGLTGQPIHNYLLPEWIKTMSSNPAAFHFKSYETGPAKARFDWKQHPEWMPADAAWLYPGISLTFIYLADDVTINALAKSKNISPSNLTYLKNVTVKVHYELYDGLPLICKWISVENKSDRLVTVNKFKSEILALSEPESMVDDKKHWLLPNITIETDYQFGGMSSENSEKSSYSWSLDSLYLTQVNYNRLMPCLLECYPKYGPEQQIGKDETFESFRTWELVNDSYDRERKTLGHRRMMRAMAPWVTENPVLMHVRMADDQSVKKAVDQCAEVGFEMVIMTFGSGFNIEDSSASNLLRMKQLSDYAHSKGIALGGYSLLASRSIDATNDVVMPAGMKPTFGNSPCIESKWGQEYFKNLYRFYEETGLDILEHDGSYPGDVCASESHPGHKGLGDSQWNQYRTISEFYKWCRIQGIYLNVPDYYYLAGSNKSGMGYRETNWSLPREQQEIIERQNIYDGTWDKTPSMGWMFVPLVEYQGGGEAATIEPLSQHLPHYNQRLANLFGAGVQACYRGPQLYDTPETREIVKTWVDFYKKHRRILDADIIHIRRPDGKDYDAILHVDPFGEEKGLLMVYNPLNTEIKRTLRINLYYTGLHDKVQVTDKHGKSTTFSPDRNYFIDLEVTVPAKSQGWWVMK